MKKIFKSKLTLKIFIVTTMLLVLSSMITLGLISKFMPQNYAYQLNERLEKNTDELLNNLSSQSLEEAEKTLENFYIENDTVFSLSKTTADREKVVVYISGSVWDEEKPLIPTVSVSGNYDEIKSYIQSDPDIIGEAYMTYGVEEPTDIPEYEWEPMDGDISIGVEEHTDIPEYVFEYTNSMATWEDDMSIQVVESIEAGPFTAEEYLVTFADSDEVFSLVIGGDLQEVDRSVEALKNVIPYVFVAVMIISVFGALFYSYFITKPIIQLNESSKKLAKLDFNINCLSNRKDELGELSFSMNEMALELDATLSKLKTANEKLESDINLERELKEKQLSFFSAVSHELKTPITIIRGQLEGMLYRVGRYEDRDKYLQRSLQVTTSMQELVQEILASSKLGFSSVHLNSEEISLEELVEETLLNYEEFILEKQIQCVKYYTQNLFVNADRQMFSKVISNLINNALQYSPTGERLIIEFNNVQNTPILTIENTGINIPIEEIDKLCDPFYRVEKSRNKQTGGSGLGLYLVSSIVAIHDFKFTLENTDRGVKATVICNNEN